MHNRASQRQGSLKVLEKNNQRIFYSVVLAVGAHALLLGIQLSTDTQKINVANEINLSLRFESPTKPAIEPEPISSDLLSETEVISDVDSELTKPQQEGKEIFEDQLLELSNSFVTLEAIRAFTKKDVASQKAGETQDSFTQHEYIDELRNNPIGEQRFATSVESYQNLNGTYVSLNLNGKQHCFQTVDDSFSQSDFSATSLAMVDLLANCQGSRTNFLSDRIEARRNR